MYQFKIDGRVVFCGTEEACLEEAREHYYESGACYDAPDYDEWIDRHVTLVTLPCLEMAGVR